MINITIIRTNQNIMTIEVTGHSGYAVSGKDIVCSAVSVLTESLINGLTDVVGVNADYVIDEAVPYLRVSLPKDLDEGKMRVCQILMQTTYNGLNSVADSYSKYINIKEK